MKRYMGLVPVLVMPAIIAVYLALFWNSVKDMPIQSSGYPKILVVGILFLLPFLIWHETAPWRRGHLPAVSFKAAWLSWHKVVYTAVAVIAYVFLMEPLGGYLSSAIFIAGLAIALGYRRPPILASLVGCAMLLIFAFDYFLHIALPGV
ncbi:tripartite tricarboxylate transporter TctB family protein [Sinorhizobium meliloti]|uniref:DUF1468 domain-containing protein n=1 Tax=Rhizobium meliloti TaxID=382 RepID=A0A2J0YYT0_RHIML|nr:tripartite tricarboxylate transporter TctB family protein [Sinorhizobium meliloti]PJR13443.1 hypothetical protein CEJ86_22160 [Sinorhizobium meliloti]